MLVWLAITEGKQLRDSHRLLAAFFSDDDLDLWLQIQQNLATASTWTQDPALLVRDRHDVRQLRCPRSSSNTEHHQLCTRTAGEVVDVDTGKDASVGGPGGTGDTVVFREGDAVDGGGGGLDQRGFHGAEGHCLGCRTVRSLQGDNENMTLYDTILVGGESDEVEVDEWTRIRSLGTCLTVDCSDTEILLRYWLMDRLQVSYGLYDCTI